jgi:hypothetical protein
MADWLSYSNQGATRSLGLDPKLAEALSFLRDMGVTADVFSGGQPGQGSGQPRVGSTRHDHGMAADVRFIKDGRALDWSNPQDVPLFQEIVKRGKAAGLTGFGAGPGYMGQGTMHVGFGAPAVWGAGGKGSNAPSWLRDAYYGAPAVAADTMAALGRAPTGGSPVNTLPQSPAQAPAKPSFWDKLGPLSDPDRRARLAIALEGMTLNPNKGLIENAQAGIEERRVEQTKNRTAEWLRSQGRRDLADAMLSGGLDAKSAVGIAMQKATRDIRELDGKLVEVHADGSVTELYGGGQATPKPADVMSLRKEFSARPEAANYSSISRQYANIAAAAASGTGPGDINLVFSFMKMIDPGSTVNSGEQATAQNAGGVDSKVRGLYNQLIGGGSMDAKTRQQFVAQAEALYNNAKTAYDPLAEYYRGLATQYGYDPNQVVAPIGGTSAPPAGTGITVTPLPAPKTFVPKGK